VDKQGRTHEFGETFNEPVDRAMAVPFPSREEARSRLDVSEVYDIGHVVGGMGRLDGIADWTTIL
jgi:hypothetical protein